MSEDFAYRAKVLITQRRYQDAVRLCRRGLLTDPSREEGRLVLGMALLAMRRFEEVRAEMLALLRSRPEDSVARRLLGQTFLEAGDYVRAEEELEAARRLAPKDPRIAALIRELAEAREESEAPSEPSGRWAEPEDLQTTPGEVPAAEEAPRAAPARARSMVRDFFEETPTVTPTASTSPTPALEDERVPPPGDERTVPDPGPPAVRLDLAGLGSVITKVLPHEDAERIRKASKLLAEGEAPAPEPAAAAPAVAPPAAAPPAVAPSDEDVVGAEPPTNVVGPSRPTAQAPGAVSFAGAKGWPEEPPPTITPVMPALVRAAARLAAATRGKSSLRPAPELPDPPSEDAPTPAPVLSPVAAAPAPAPAPAAVPAPTAAPPAASPPRGFSPLDIDTKSYAEASEEARARDAVRPAEQRPRRASIEEVLAAQAKFADAVSEISEVSEVEQSALPRPAVEIRAPVRTPEPERPSEPPTEADSTEEEPESTVTEVPQSYRDGAPPRGGAGRAAAPATAAPTVPPAGDRTSSPMTVVAKPVGNMPTQHAAEDGAPQTTAGRPPPVVPSRPVPEPPRARPMSETAQAPSLPEERVTRSLDPAERVDRESSLPPARLSQPPSFLDVPAEPSRRAAKAAAPTAGPAARLMIPPAPTMSPGLSSLPPPMPPPDRVTMPVIDDEEAEGPKRSSKPTVDGTPRDLLGADLRDSEDSLIGPADRYDEMSGRGDEPPFARRELPRAPAAPPPAAAPAFKPPQRADRAAAFDPLDRPLSPEEFESSISRGPVVGGSALTSSSQESAFLGPEDVVSGSEQVVLPEAIEAIIPAPGRSGSPLDEPLSPDDFSYSGPAADRPPSSISVAPGGDGNPLDEPLSPDDFSYDRDRARAVAAPGSPAPKGPVAPLVGPAPPMAVPRDALRAVPMHSALVPAAQVDLLDEPLAPSEFSEAAAPAPKRVAPKRAEAKAAPPKQKAPVRIVAKKGQAPVKVSTKPLPKQRPRTDSRLLRYAIPSAVLAIVVVLGVSGVAHWRAGRLRAEKVERAEKAEAQGDYGSLREALVAYREVSDEIPDSREALARVERTYALLSFEFGLPDDEREAQALRTRIASMAPPDAASAQVEAEASAYLLAASGRIDDAELMLRPFQTPDPHLVYLRARIFLHRENYVEAEHALKATTFTPSWVRHSCALVEAYLGKDPQGTEWLRFLESLGTSYGSHVGVRLLRARLLADSPHTAENARLELQALAQPALWNAAAPSEQAWVHLLNAFLALEKRDSRVDPARELLAARDLRPVRDAKFRLMFVRVLLGLRQLGEAKAELQSIVRDAPPRARAQARLLLAETHLDLGEVEQAESLLAQAEESPRLHLLKGRVLMAKKLVANAIEEFTIAKDRDPSLAVQVDLESSRAHLQINDVSTAIALATELLRLHPNEVRALLLLGDAYLADTSRADRVARAEEKYRQAAAQSPDSFEAQLRLVDLARGRGDLDGANQMIDQILARDAGNVQAHIERASIAGEAGNLEDARAKLARVQQLPNARAEAGAIAVLEAELALRSGTTDGVEALLERAEQAGAQESDLKHVRGLFLLRTYKVQDALASLRRASQLAPADAVRLGELARAYRLSDTASGETEQIADSALAIDRRVAEALVVKALIAMDKGALGPAANLLRDADRALEARPRDAGVRAYVLMAKGRYEGEWGRAAESQRLLDQALQLDPNLAEAHLNLGLAYPDLGRERDACTELGRFMELAPGVRDTNIATSERRRLRCR